MASVKKILSVLLIAALALSAFSLSFTANAASGSTVSVSVIGLGTVSNGETQSMTDIVWEYSAGDAVTITAQALDGFEFLFWINVAQKRVVSYNASYSFYAGSDMILQAYFDTSESVLAASGRHRIIYFSEGGNILYSGEQPIGYDGFYGNVTTAGLHVEGRTWTGEWTSTLEEVAAAPGRIYVYPVYTDVSSYEITTIVGDTVETVEAEYSKNYTVHAPSTLDGKAFSYWMVPADEDNAYSVNEIASYSANYTFRVCMATTLVAVYTGSIGSGIAVRIVGETHDFEQHSITFYADHSVKGYTVTEYGLIFTRDVETGNRSDEFIIDSTNSLIKQSYTKSSASDGTHYVTITSWYDVLDESTETYYYPPLYVRPYVIVKNASGTSITRYGNIFCADYSNEAFIGVIEGDNHPDPFG